MAKSIKMNKKEESDAWVLGDIVRFCLQWSNIKTKDFSLYFRKDCAFFYRWHGYEACVLLQKQLNGGTKTWLHLMRRNITECVRYKLRCSVLSWLSSDNREPRLNNFWDGSAMRISPMCLDHGLWFYAKTGIWPSSGGLTSLSAEVTHNHPEGQRRYGYSQNAIFSMSFLLWWTL